MACIKKLSNGNWTPCHGQTGKVLKRAQPGGHERKRDAKKEAAKIASDGMDRSVPISEVKVWDGSGSSPDGVVSHVLAKGRKWIYDRLN